MRGHDKRRDFHIFHFTPVVRTRRTTVIGARRGKSLLLFPGFDNTTRDVVRARRATRAIPCIEELTEILSLKSMEIGIPQPPPQSPAPSPRLLVNPTPPRQPHASSSTSRSSHERDPEQLLPVVLRYIDAERWSWTFLRPYVLTPLPLPLPLPPPPPTQH